jgi:hypothetical protein
LKEVKVFIQGLSLSSIKGKNNKEDDFVDAKVDD